MILQSFHEQAATIFNQMDMNNDGKVSRKEFVGVCLKDQKLFNLLTSIV